jgi:hypothetical protein
LEDLDGVLEREMASIFMVREKVQKLKRDLKESVKI